MKKIIKKIISIFVLSSVLIMCLCCMKIFADAATDNANIVCEKEEQIIADLNADGSVAMINTINTIYSKDNKVIDYGDYDKITNISSADRLKYIDGEISAKTSYDKLIYMGRNVSKDLPWDISIKYYLDGENIAPNDIIGKSGKVDFRIMINRNEHYVGDFYDDFLVETSVKLSDSIFKNIIADKNAFSSDATSTILRYYKMPGEDLDITFSADATCFSLDEITFNAMSVGFYENKNTIFEDEEDEKDTKEEISDLSDATEELYDGIRQIYDVTNDILEDIDVISDGAGKLNDGMNDFNSSSKEINDNIILAYKNVDELIPPFSDIKNSLENIFSIQEVSDNVPAEIRNSIIGTIDDILDKLNEIKSNSTSIRNNSLTLIDGSLELKTGTELFNEKIDEFIDAIIELRDGTNDLFDGAGEVDDGVKNIKDRIDGISTNGKNNSDNQSFSSVNNTNVLNVVFTLKTEKLEHEYVSLEDDNQNTEKGKNFFEKISSILISYFDNCFTMKVYAAETKDYTLSDCGFMDKDGKVFATWDEPADTTSYRLKIYKNNKRISDWLKTTNERYDITKYILKNKTGHYYFEVYSYKGGRDQKITSEELEVDSEYYMYLLGYEEKAENLIEENKNTTGDIKSSYKIINQDWADKETLTYDEYGRIKNIRLYTSNRLIDVNNIIKKNFVNSRYYKVIEERYDNKYEDWKIGEKVKCYLTIGLNDGLMFADNVAVECVNANIVSSKVTNNNENLAMEILYYPRCKIEKPENIYIDSNDIIKWDRVDNATHYRVRIYDAIGIIGMKKVGANNVNMKDYLEENYKLVKVSAINERSEKFYVESEPIELDIIN